MVEHMQMDHVAAQEACRRVEHGGADYAAAGERLKAGLTAAGTTQDQETEVGAALGEFTGLLTQAADRIAQSVGATAARMGEAVTGVRGAEEATAAALPAVEV